MLQRASKFRDFLQLMQWSQRISQGCRIQLQKIRTKLTYYRQPNQALWHSPVVPHTLQIESGGLEAQDWLRQLRSSLLKMNQ